VDEGKGLEECHKVMKRIRRGEEESKVMRWMKNN
jgi:hypothetical protein